MKDNFSSRSDQYAQFRPSYPPSVFNFLNDIIFQKEKAWDCGTGNGQVAFEISKIFKTVFATDISQSQINHALQAKNIVYSVQPAENTDFKNQQFDLVIVGQAIHWFDFEKFYTEVKRTTKKDALICVMGYDRIKVTQEIDSIITDFYTNVIGQYWDPERTYIDNHYNTIPFPFEEIPAPEFSYRINWSLEHLIGYINTWSAVKHFIKQNKFNPVDRLYDKITPFWNPEEIKEVAFPSLLRIGKVH